MRQQAFLDGIRSSRGMGMADTRMRDDRSADQDRSQSGNPRTIFNQPVMRGLAQGSGVGGFGTPAGYENPADKMPPQSFHRAVRPQFGQLQGGAPGQQQQMPPQTQQQLMLQQQQLLQQQQQQQPMQRQRPVDPRSRFTRPMFRQ